MTVLQMLKPHAGLRVLVTGGASGIGLVIARAFADAGSRVHVCDASQAHVDALVQAESSTEVNAITATLADVADRAAVERVFADVETQLGGLDVLINNAGIAGPTGAIEELDVAQWEETVDVNLNAQFYVARRAVPLLRHARESFTRKSATPLRTIRRDSELLRALHEMQMRSFSFLASPPE